MTVRERLEIRCHDINTEVEGLTAPSAKDAATLVRTLRKAMRAKRHVMAVCEGGAGRSSAVIAAAVRLGGGTEHQVWEFILKRGSYNRRLYRLTLEAAGLPLPAEPLVSIVVRVKYPVDRLAAFLLSLKRQRWPHWECIAVTDGPNPDAIALGETHERLYVIETAKRLGHWGHPHRQVGIDAAKGKYLGLQNDDNYLTPGFLEQCVMALEDSGADICFFDMPHSYLGWFPFKNTAEGADVGGWIAKRSLVTQVPWTGREFTSDKSYIARLAAKAKMTVSLPGCLVVHN